MYIVYFFRGIIEYFYVKYNQTATILKRDFNNLSYFEKLFLTFFYRNNIFNKSIANIFTNNNLLKFRQSNYPLIFFFHLYYDRFDYIFSDLKILVKYYRYFNNSKVFKKTLMSLRSVFFKNKVKSNRISNFLIFLIVQKFLFKRYYNLCSSIYFKAYSTNNLVKLNWLFYIFLTNSKNLLKIYDLSKYDEWYIYNFKEGIVKKHVDKVSKRFIKKPSPLKKKFSEDRIKYLIKIYKHYNFFLKSFVKNYKSLYTSSLIISKNFFVKITLDKRWYSILKAYYPVRFSESSLSKHIKLENINNYVFFYIRKNRIFNKGRYSRNRQLYRTGVYWCLWLNVMLVYGLYFLFYRFTFNFGYLWWGLLIFMYSTIFSRVLKYNFFNIFYVRDEMLNFLKWVGFLVLNIKYYIVSFLGNLATNNYLLSLPFIKSSLFINYLYDVFLAIILYIRELFIFKNSGKFIYFWESMSHKDESFLRYKTIIHWFTQLYKLLTY